MWLHNYKENEKPKQMDVYKTDISGKDLKLEALSNSFL